MRVVADTNILISAFVFPGGPPEGILRAAIERRIELVTSPALLAEFARVLTAKFGWDDAHVREAVALVGRVAVVVRPTERLRVVREDPDDDRVIEAAVTGAARTIVSGDRHLLRLGSYRDVAIVRASDLLASLEDPA